MVKLRKESKIQGIPDTEEEVIDSIRGFIEERIEDNWLEDIEIIEIALHGSRMRGQARKNSDLDAVVQYKGDIREDDLFDILNEHPLRLYGIRVDINPIQEPMASYMARSREYDKKKLAER